MQELRERLIEDISLTLFDTVGDLIPGPAGKPKFRSPELTCRKIAVEYHDQLFGAVQNQLFLEKRPGLIPGLGQILWDGKQPPQFLAAIESSEATKSSSLFADDETVRLKLQGLLIVNYLKIEDILKQKPGDAAQELARWLIGLHEDVNRQLITSRPVFIASLGMFKIENEKITFNPSEHCLLMIERCQK